jgi:Na+-driven multidrug efflux pump
MVRRSLASGLVVSLLVATTAARDRAVDAAPVHARPGIIESATTLLWLTVLLEPGRTCNIVVINALRADRRRALPGDGRRGVDAAGDGGRLLAARRALRLGLVGVWIAYAADEWLRGLIMVARWWRMAGCRWRARRAARAGAAARWRCGAEHTG